MLSRLREFFQKEKVLLLTILAVLILASAGLAYYFHKRASEKPSPSTSTVSEYNPPVGFDDTSGTTNSAPPEENQNSTYVYLSIYDASGGGGNNGVIEQTSSSEPAISVNGGGTDEAVISLYSATKDDLLAFLEHNAKGEQLNSKVDTSKLNKITSLKATFTKSNSSAHVALPIAGSGIWYVTAKSGDIIAKSFILRSNFGVIAKKNPDKFVFWGQDLTSKRSVSNGDLSLYSLENGLTTISSTTFGSNGIAETSLAQADIALATYGDDISITPINLNSISADANYGFFENSYNIASYFVFTDRPLYHPGDTVNYKAILRNDDDANYTIPTGAASVKLLTDSSSDPISQKSIAISSNGSIDGSFDIPVTAKLGDYYIDVEFPRTVNGMASAKKGEAYFQVQYYRKPDYHLDSKASQNEIIMGSKAEVQISGNYFFGQPTARQKISYKISSTGFSNYEYLSEKSGQSDQDSLAYQYWYGNNEETKGEITLDANGNGTITYDTNQLSKKGKDQVVTIEATLDDATGNPSLTRSNILVYAGNFGIFRDSGNQTAVVNTAADLPLILSSQIEKPDLSNIDLTAKVTRTNWVSKYSDGQKYPTYVQETENLPDISAKTDISGKATLQFTPTKVGSYTLSVTSHDSHDNLVTKDFFIYVTDKQTYYASGGAGVSVTADKKQYAPGDKATLIIQSDVADRDILLSFERDYEHSYQIVPLIGKEAIVQFDITDKDIPNISADVSSFSSNRYDSADTNLLVLADSKKLSIGIDSVTKAGPGDNINIDVSTEDNANKPVAGEVALWVVDKSIFELTSTNLGDIFKTFWSDRGNSTRTSYSLSGISGEGDGKGGCFLAGTEVTLADNQNKPIERVKIGESVRSRDDQGNIVSGKVIGLHSQEETGYFVLNNNLNVTYNHLLRADNTWKRADEIQIGNSLYDENGNIVKVESIEWRKETNLVYNLEIENYHNYFANRYFVHNGKGGGGGRDLFKDTAYWNPKVTTDANGSAKVNFKLPDNLTTWTIVAVGATNQTIVGQNTKDLVVTKDFLLRPVLPNILRPGDSLSLSALAQNYTGTAKTANISISSDALEIKEPSGVATLENNLPSTVAWPVTVKNVNEAKITYTAKDESGKTLDSVTQTVPVTPFNFDEQEASSASGSTQFSVKMPNDAINDKSKISLSLSPSMTGLAPDAMKYLVSYPYGCSEQTASAFIPLILYKQNPKIFGDATAGLDLDEMATKDIQRLVYLQNGTWSWWKNGKPNPLVSAYVVESLVAAQKAGYALPSGMLESAGNAMTMIPAGEPNETTVAYTYATALLNTKDRNKKIENLDSLSPEYLAWAVMANYLNGNKDKNSNGLARLESLAQMQGDAAFWPEGSTTITRSKAASTALAVRAILLAGGDKSLAIKGIRYLARNRSGNYWSNSFATAQSLRAISEFSSQDSGSKPNYTYEVLLDNIKIGEGKVTDYSQKIAGIAISSEKILENGSNLEIKQSGEGDLFSTLVINRYRTDQGAPTLSNGNLKLTREYLTDSGSLNVGDTVTVRLILEGLKADENYAIIKDELPAGLIPVNEYFNNETNTNSSTSASNDINLIEKETTLNGMNLSIYHLKPGKQTFTYKARIVAAGTFVAPPATASLMYAPEVNARTISTNIKISDKLESSNGISTESNVKRAIAKISHSRTFMIAGSLFVVICIVLLAFYLRKRK